MACHEAVKDTVLPREEKKTGDPVLRLTKSFLRIKHNQSLAVRRKIRSKLANSLKAQGDSTPNTSLLIEMY